MFDLLRGLIVVEASSFIAAPSCGLYLAQMGARVIRVDQIGGGPDFNRWPVTDEGASLYWENLNRAKESVAVDLSSREGRDLLARMVGRAGVFLTNFPADGFTAHEHLRQSCEDLVTVRVTGRADGGSALDYTVNAAVGYPLQTGEGPGPVNHVLPAWDLLAGAYAAFALLAALRRRDATGEGGEVRVPLEDVAIGTASNLGALAEVLLRGTDRPRYGNSVYGAFGRDFVTRDGERIMLMAITPRQWRAVVDVLQLSEAVATVEAERGVSFARDEGKRFTHRDALYPLFEAAIAGWDHAELAAALDAAGGCHARYRTMLEAAQEAARTEGNPIFSRPDNPSDAVYPAAGAFAHVMAAERGDARPAPQLGQHSFSVLRDVLAMDDAEVRALHARGVIADG